MTPDPWLEAAALVRGIYALPTGERMNERLRIRIDQRAGELLRGLHDSEINGEISWFYDPSGV